MLDRSRVASPPLDWALLDVLRRELGLPGLGYAEPPRALPGGFFTDVYGMRLSGAAPEWSGPLVLRVFPEVAGPDAARRERAVQNAVCAQDFAAPRVLYATDDPATLGRGFLVMERLAGRTLMGGIGTGRVIRQGPGLLRRLPSTVAALQRELHRLDPEPLLRDLDEAGVGRGSVSVERWLLAIESVAASEGGEGLRAGLGWLRENRPPEPARPSICHGDLWPGNILVHSGRITGVIDWNLTTVTDRAFDVGFSRMALRLAPVDVPPVLERIVVRVARGMAVRYYAAYTDGATLDERSVRYYEALRCALELSGVFRYRVALAQGRGTEIAEPTWNRPAGRVVRLFEAITGVPIVLP